MNLVFRMVYVYLLSLFRPRLTLAAAESVLHLRVLPNDLDLNMHMNDGRYITICDLNRVDLFIRSGLMKVMLQKKWMPVIAEHSMTYKRSLTLFQPFTITTNITHWDDKGFYMQHTFTVAGRIVAQGGSTGMIRNKQGVIPPEEVIASLDVL